MKKKEEKENGERWLLTYSDLITLLMILFVVMYALSNVDQNKFKQLAHSLNYAMGSGTGETMNLGTGGASLNVVGSIDNPVVDTTTAQAEKNKLDTLKQTVDKYLKDNNLASSASATIQERGLVISISDTLIFDSGKADLKTVYQSKLIEIGQILNKIDNYIVVEGNTDNVPISNNEFKDNWSLASARADNVTRVLINQAGLDPLRIASRSNGQFRPISNNNSDAGKSANRRVDIVILDNKYSTTESNQAK